MGTTWGTAGRAAPTVSTEWLSATLGTLQNCPFPPPALLRTPPAPLRATQHCSGHTRIACSPPALLRTPSALLRMPPAQPILPQHISGPPGPLSIAQDPPSPSTSQDPPELPLLPQHSSGCPKHHSGPLRTVQDPLSIAHSLPAQLRPTPPIAQCPPAHLRTPPASPIPPPQHCVCCLFTSLEPLCAQRRPTGRHVPVWG